MKLHSGVTVCLLGALLSGGTAHASRGHAVVRSHAPDEAPAFYGSCSNFRNDLWPLVQRTSELLDFYWWALQRDYNGNYPVDDGGSTPGPTVAQFQLAQADMKSIYQQVKFDRTFTQNTLQNRQTDVEIKYGTDIGPVDAGPYHWAAFRSFSAMFDLTRAAKAEMTKPGQGLYDYQSARAEVQYSWDALKQLPCPSRPTLPMGAWVIPGEMPYDAHPVLKAHSTPGARCWAAVVYETDRHPVSFYGYTQTADRNGNVQWQWHEMTVGDSGRGFVTCSTQSAEGSAMAWFDVDH